MDFPSKPLVLGGPAKPTLWRADYVQRGCPRHGLQSTGTHALAAQERRSADPGLSWLNPTRSRHPEVRLGDPLKNDQSLERTVTYLDISGPSKMD